MAAAVAAVVVAALLLKVVPAVLVLALFVGGVAYANHRLRDATRKQTRSGAELLGFKREASDPFGILGYPVALFARTTDTAIDELVWGPWRGLDVRVFAASFVSPTVFEEQSVRASFACAMTRVEASLPAAVVEPQAFLTRIERPPAAPTVHTGDPQFDAALAVWSDDPAFARTLLDPPMREWLRSLDHRWGIEVHGRIVMVYGPRPDRPDVIAILETLKGFLDRLPRDLLASHPPAV